MRYHFPVLFSLAALVASAQANEPLTGLWVGEVVLDQVNEVTVPLDANNTPRAPDPRATTSTYDAASLRLILHVDSEGKTRLLKHVVVAARDEVTVDNDADVVLITDPLLYSNIGGQRASRISSATFDFADPIATAALETLVDDLAASAATIANVASPDVTAVENAALNAANLVVQNEADADARFIDFYTTNLTPGKVDDIAVGGTGSGPYTTATTEANALETGSFVKDTRGQEMLAAIHNAASAAVGDDAKKRAAKLAAASFIEEDDGYNQFLASETMRAMVDGVAQDLVGSFNLVDVVDYSPIVFETIITSAAHGLTTGDSITVANSAAIYNGAMPVEVIDADTFSISVPFESRVAAEDYWTGDAVGGGAVGSFASGGATVTQITATDHGLSAGDIIEITDSDPSYNGLHTVTVVDDDNFTIPVVYADRVIVGDNWAGPVSPITNYATGPIFVNAELASDVSLSSTNSLYIFESGLPLYNQRHDNIIAIDSRNLVLDLLFDTNTSNPTFKGQVAVIPNRADLESATNTPSADAKNAALLVNVSNYESSVGQPEIGSRSSDAVDAILVSMVDFVEAQNELPVAGDLASVGFATLDDPILVARFAQPTKSPSDAYQEFIASDEYLNAPEIAAEAAAIAAVNEAGELLANEASIRDKAKAAALTALRVPYATAARVSMNEQPVSGTFALGSTDLTTTLTLPASHPTNPFRHRRHPDHTVGLDITRVIDLTLDTEPDTFRQTGYGVFVVSGTYTEEIFGLHKNLGPDSDIGLRVSGSFTLNRVSTVDTLNAF
ncbi:MULTISPECIES: hypothetical protein [unclassified Lentimonas]|uniref:hypothetical protein n=1 Tax=unclassified Lentimonas TaxID=2630993 RepID=UPI0013209904|nr:MULTISPECIES: hypothetical protein [unclassified Lentimonas]CAA6676862.1 Unannotated [Lentimonas sp. CC4]CAA6686669.1 Unannotated [Lentimonas sp. CC6]CAA7075754.1 Unannotated [Lentimonas sp. CC4]CAA7168087.1 Unannotated [Lentimonas sp. CC21]CAA7181765.1 Unannotated [Lentimonas sp. CC8]